MTTPALQPFDVIVIDGLWYMPHHWLIRWRGLDAGVHCCTVSNLKLADGYGIISPEFTGMKLRSLSYYQGRRVTVHRHVAMPDNERFKWWLQLTLTAAKGYDFRQWLAGFILGLTCKRWVDSSKQWTCAELPYWLHQENGCLVTPLDEVLPMPRLFRFNPQFRVVFDGVL